MNSLTSTSGVMSSVMYGSVTQGKRHYLRTHRFIYLEIRFALNINCAGKIKEIIAPYQFLYIFISNTQTTRFRRHIRLLKEINIQQPFFQTLNEYSPLVEGQLLGFLTFTSTTNGFWSVIHSYASCCIKQSLLPLRYEFVDIYFWCYVIGNVWKCNAR